MKDVMKIDGKVYKRNMMFSTKTDAKKRASEIRNKGFRGHVAFARVIRSHKKEIGFKKGAGGVHVMQYHWYVYVHETQKKKR